MEIFDAHCDVLMKLFIDPMISFNDSEKLHITKQSLINNGAHGLGTVRCRRSSHRGIIAMETAFQPATGHRLSTMCRQRDGVEFQFDSQLKKPLKFFSNISSQISFFNKGP